MHKNTGIRKAAVLVASLDGAAADRVLDQMDPAQAQQVRQALTELGPVDAGEQQRVIDEFFRIRPLVPEKHPPGIELDGRLARQFFSTAAAQLDEDSASTAAAGSPPFRFLRETEADKLAKALAAERPQTVALVLAHLPPGQAGDVLVRLAPALQVEVIRRLVDLEETDPEILHEVERGLLARLSEQVRVQRRRVAGLSAVKGIVDASDPRVAMQILQNLAAHDRPLANRLGRRPFEFDDLLRLDEPALAEVVGAADSELLSLALVGALPALVERVLRRLPEAEADPLRHRLAHPGPTRLSDVEEARCQIAGLVQRLAVEGRIELSSLVERLKRAA